MSRRAPFFGPLGVLFIVSLEQGVTDLHVDLHKLMDDLLKAMVLADLPLGRIDRFGSKDLGNRLAVHTASQQLTWSMSRFSLPRAAAAGFSKLMVVNYRRPGTEVGQ